VERRADAGAAADRECEPERGRARHGRCLQRFQPRGHYLTRGDQVGYDAFIDVEVTFVFAEVANLVTLIQDTPHFGAEVERVRQRLEDDVTMIRAKPVMAQSSKAERMRRVVSEVEPTLQRVGPVARIFQPCKSRTF